MLYAKYTCKGILLYECECEESLVRNPYTGIIDKESLHRNLTLEMQKTPYTGMQQRHQLSSYPLDSGHMDMRQQEKKLFENLIRVKVIQDCLFYNYMYIIPKEKFCRTKQFIFFFKVELF